MLSLRRKPELLRTWALQQMLSLAVKQYNLHLVAQQHTLPQVLVSQPEQVLEQPPALAMLGPWFAISALLPAISIALHCIVSEPSPATFDMPLSLFSGCIPWSNYPC